MGALNFLLHSAHRNSRCGKYLRLDLPRALAVIGAGKRPEVLVPRYRGDASRRGARRPRDVRLPAGISIAEIPAPRRGLRGALRQKSAGTSAKVFNWKELALGPGESVAVTRCRVIRDFTTRVHHPGRHVVEIAINGEILARDFFDPSRWQRACTRSRPAVRTSVMSDGVLVQGSREIPYRHIAFIRGVIAGDVAASAGLQPGDAHLVVNGRDFSGSVIEIANGEAVFSASRLEEIIRALDPKAPDPKLDELRADDGEPVARIVERSRKMGF